jgi:hypothetical protein
VAGSSGASKVKEAISAAAARRQPPAGTGAEQNLIKQKNIIIASRINTTNTHDNHHLYMLPHKH